MMRKTHVSPIVVPATTEPFELKDLKEKYPALATLVAPDTPPQLMQWAVNTLLVQCGTKEGMQGVELACDIIKYVGDRMSAMKTDATTPNLNAVLIGYTVAINQLATFAADRARALPANNDRLCCFNLVLECPLSDEMKEIVSSEKQTLENHIKAENQRKAVDNFIQHAKQLASQKGAVDNRDFMNQLSGLMTTLAHMNKKTFFGCCYQALGLIGRSNVLGDKDKRCADATVIRGYIEAVDYLDADAAKQQLDKLCHAINSRNYQGKEEMLKPIQKRLTAIEEGCWTPVDPNARGLSAAEAVEILCRLVSAPERGQTA